MVVLASQSRHSKDKNMATAVCSGYQALKGHSQLCDRSDLDTSFVTFEKRLPQPEIKRYASNISGNPLQSSQCFIGFSIFY